MDNKEFLLKKKWFWLITIFVLLGSISCVEIAPTEKQTIDDVWVCNEIHEDLGERKYYTEITYNEEDSTQIYIFNFLGLSNDLTHDYYAVANVSGTSITIPLQTIDNHQVKGSGEISDDYKTISFTYTDKLYETWSVTSDLERME
ncbi:MAG: hypothetical protein IPO21_10665 [Bacteroidales bacterium]|nr:hypothetical protein [Bacteroidales bacterium]